MQKWNTLFSLVATYIVVSYCNGWFLGNEFRLGLVSRIQSVEKT